MKIKFLPFFCLVCLMAACRNNTGVSHQTVMTGQTADSTSWFKEAKFGMFIHWGPYSALAGEWNGKTVPVGENAEWIMQKLQIPVEEYRKMAATFHPVDFNAQEWVSLAKNAGMKYLVITAKHHDGFAMYDSKVSDYNIVDFTPFDRDPIKELAEECRKAGIVFGVYYSHREDWDHPYGYGNTWDYATSQTNLDSMDHPELFREYLEKKSLPQVKELLTDYGPVGLIWFDRGMYTQEQGREFADLVHSLQPACLVNGRVGHYFKDLLGDYQSLTDNGMPAGGIEEYWESPQTLNETWGYSKFDHRWKTAPEIIRRLVVIVSKGGNYLLNIGPDGLGNIPAPSVDVLEKVGQWISKNGESIYGTSASPFPQDQPWGYCTTRNNLIYLHVFEWPENQQIEIKGLHNDVHQAHFLPDPDKPLRIEKDTENRLFIHVPPDAPDTVNTVIVLETEGTPVADPLLVEQQEDKEFQLDYLSATTSGDAAKRFNRKGSYHIAGMQDTEDKISWNLLIRKPGRYQARLTYATSPEWTSSQFIIRTGNREITAQTEITEGWFDYHTMDAGILIFPESGETGVEIYPATETAHPLMFFKSLELIPVE